MIKEYLKTWKSILKITEPLSRRGFWSFLGLNYLFFLIINGLIELIGNITLYNLLIFLPPLFAVSSILAIIKNLGRKVNTENDTESKEKVMGIYDFIKLLIISIGIGGINFLWAMTSNSNSLNAEYVILIYCICLIPITTIVFLMRATLLKRKVTNEILFVYFIVFLILSLILHFGLTLLDS